MTATVEKLAREIRGLPEDEFDQFLSWLAQYEAENVDEWDREIERDARCPGGKLQTVLDRVRDDISAGRTRSLDEVLHDS